MPRSRLDYKEQLPIKIPGGETFEFEQDLFTGGPGAVTWTAKFYMDCGEGLVEKVVVLEGTCQ